MAIALAAVHEAAGLAVDVIRRKKMVGRAVLLAGLPATGMTALAPGMLGTVKPTLSLVPRLHARPYLHSECMGS